MNDDKHPGYIVTLTPITHLAMMMAHVLKDLERLAGDDSDCLTCGAWLEREPHQETCRWKTSMDKAVRMGLVSI